MHSGIIPESLPNGISFKYINGQAYYILTFDQNYSIKPNEKIKFSFLQKGILKRKPYGPLGAFIRNHETDELFNLPLTFNWRNAKNLDKINTKKNETEMPLPLCLSELYSLLWLF